MGRADSTVRFPRTEAIYPPSECKGNTFAPRTPARVAKALPLHAKRFTLAEIIAAATG